MRDRTLEEIYDTCITNGRFVPVANEDKMLAGSLIKLGLSDWQDAQDW